MYLFSLTWILVRVINGSALVQHVYYIKIILNLLKYYRFNE